MSQPILQVSFGSPEPLSQLPAPVGQHTPLQAKIQFAGGKTYDPTKYVDKAVQLLEEVKEYTTLNLTYVPQPPKAS